MGKTALVLSGGGAKGSFQIGVLDYLLNEKKMDFDIICGVSVGSLNASMVAQGDFPKLLELWEGIRSNRDIYKKKFLGLLGGFLGSQSMYDNKPLWKKIDKYINPDKIRKNGKELRIGSVSLQTTKYISINQNNKNLKKWVLASTSIPIAFHPPFIDNEQIVDGGIRDITPLSTAINLGAEKIVVVLASPSEIPYNPKHYKSLIHVGIRTLEILLAEIYENDLKVSRKINATVQLWRKIMNKIEGADELCKEMGVPLNKYREVEIVTIMPQKEVIDTLEFNPVKIREAIVYGKEMAQNIIP
ncbi:patatin-like phospholipase family protein [bacterium]|nr:patatin-like phospholipase family protein [bacterium]